MPERMTTSRYRWPKSSLSKVLDLRYEMAMSKRFVIAVFANVLIVGVAGHAQDSVPPEVPSVSEEADHEQLRNLRAVFEEAASNNQMERLKPYLAEGFSAVTFTDREFKDFESFQKQWQITREQMLDGGSYKVSLEPGLSDLHGDWAIALGNSKNAITDAKGNTTEFDAHWTAVCVKEDGVWKILRAHCSLDPFGNPMMIDGVKKVVLKCCLSAALAGAFMTWIVVNFISRRRQKTT